MKEYRRRIWIDSFQTGLLVRIALYCVMYNVVAWFFFAICEVIDGSLASLGVQSHFFSNGLVRSLLALVALLPPLVWDAIRFAHRLVGPIYRFRKTIQAIAAGEPVSLVQLRKDDFLTDLRDDFNAMLRQLEQKGLVLVEAPAASQPTATPQPVNGRAPTTVGVES